MVESTSREMMKNTLGQYTPLGQALTPCMKYTKVGIACLVFEYNKHNDHVTCSSGIPEAKVWETIIFIHIPREEKQDPAGKTEHIAL